MSEGTLSLLLKVPATFVLEITSFHLLCILDKVQLLAQFQFLKL